MSKSTKSTNASAPNAKPVLVPYTISMSGWCMWLGLRPGDGWDVTQ